MFDKTKTLVAKNYHVPGKTGLFPALAVQEII